MKRSELKRRTALKAKKALARGTARLKRGKRLRAKKKLKAFNAKRKARLYAVQFGEKGTDMVGLPCWVTGTPPSESVAVDNAHVGSPDPDERKRTRGAGADSTYLARLRRDVHRSFDEDTDAVFERLWLTSKQYVREQAAEFDRIHKAKLASVFALSQESGTEPE